MKEQKKPLSTDPVKLRRRGEERLKESATETDQPLTNGDTQKLLHELQLYQVELEMQNEELKGAKETIEAGLAKYSELYDFAPVGYFSFDRNGAILQVNLTGAGILGIERSLLVKQLFGIFISQADRAVFTSFLQKVFEGEEKRSCELMLLSKNKEPLYARIDARILRDGRECLATVVDISERRQAEEALELNLAKYHALVESFPLAITMADANGIIVESNKEAERLLGLSRQEQVKRRIDGSQWRLIRPDGSPMPTDELASVRALKDNCLVENVEMGIVKGDEGVTWINVTAAPIPLEGYGVAIAYGDITERKRMEDEREVTMELLRLISSTSDHRELMTAVTRLLRDCTDCEAVGVRQRAGDDFPYFETTGFPPEFVRAESSLCAVDLRGEAIRDSRGSPVLECMCGNILCGRFNPALPFFTDRGSFWTNSTTALLAGTSEADRMARMRNRCNGEGYESVALIPVRTGGETYGLLQFNDKRLNRFTRDKIALLERIADHLASSLAQRLAEQALKDSEKRYRLLFESNPQPLWVYDIHSMSILDVNDAAVHHYGYTRDEFLGMTIRDIHLPEHIPALVDAVRSIPGSFRKPGVWKQKKKDGAIIDVEITTHDLDYGGRPARFVLANDITDRKRAEEELDSLRRKNELILNSAGDGILGLSSEGRHTFVNHAAAHMLGYEAAELIGRSSHSTWHLRREDGTPHPEDECPIYLSIRNGTVHREMGDTFCRKDGSRFPVEYSCNPVFEGEKSVGAVVVFKDISERRKAEQEREVLDAQLRQAQKMEAIGSLAGGIAHDFNNILGAIMGFTDMALDEIKEGSLARQDLEQVRKASHRARDLVTQILAFSRQGETRERRPVEMGPIVKEALKLMRATLPSTIEIKRKIPEKPRVVIADPTQIHQILVNLCTNAAHAMSERGGILEVTVADVELDAAGDIAYPNLKPGSYLRLSVRDTGHGMDRATLERIFDPYFTTKRVGEGSGLGLAVVHGIVQRHEGAVSVESDPGKGTVFHILFPMVESAPERDGKGLFPMREGSERILFVDDEEALVTLSERMLRSLGYNVTVETNGIEALDLFRAQPDAFDLIITDYTMPHMTGIELAREILRIRPAIPIILCTGFSAGVNAEKAREAGIREFAMKPLIMSTISEAIRKALSLD
jgi:PAS domain S-box-containing protein